MPFREPLSLPDNLVDAHTKLVDAQREKSLPPAQRTLSAYMLKRTIEAAETELTALMQAPDVLLTSVQIVVDGIERAQNFEALKQQTPAPTPRRLQYNKNQLARFRGMPSVQAALYCVEKSGIELGVSVPEAAAEPIPLLITVDSQYHVALNDEPVSLSMKQRADNLASNEAEARRLRVAVLKLFVDYPAKQFTPQEICAAVLDQGQFDEHIWKMHLRPFLQTPPEYRGEPLVVRGTEGKGHSSYGLGNFDAYIHTVKGTLDIPNEKFFVFPDRREVAGRVMGRLGNLLWRASRNQPLFGQDIVDAGIYTAEELALASTTPGKKLSTLVSAFKNQYLINKTNDVRIVTVKIEEESGNQKTGYFMEYADPQSSASEMEVAGSEQDYIDALPMEEARVLASLLLVNSQVLEDDRLPQLPRESLQAIVRMMPSSVNTEVETSLTERRQKVLQKVILLLHAHHVLERYLRDISDGDQSDARTDMLTYLVGVKERGFIDKVAHLPTALKARQIEVDRKSGMIVGGNTRLYAPYGQVL